MLPLLTLLLVLPSCLPPDVKDNTSQTFEEVRLRQHVKSLRAFAETQNACCTYGIFIDMSKPSWENRFFVVNLQNDSIVISGLCAHGGGRQYNGERVIFSNEPGSLLSSEGRYKIGAKYYGAFGMSYRLHGLDATNNKALERAVVFHSMSCIPDEEGEPVCMSNGCPMVSPNVLKRTAALIDQTQQPMLMWIYK